MERKASLDWIQKTSKEIKYWQIYNLQGTFFLKRQQTGVAGGSTGYGVNRLFFILF